MAGNTTRIMIKTFVKSALKDADKAPDRCTRKLVDMALNFSKGRFQQQFFEMAQTMLNNSESPYYPLIEDTLKHVDKDRLINFGMNIGYNGCTLGAHMIRKQKRENNRDVSWYQILSFSGAESLDSYNETIRENKELGVYVYILEAKENPSALLPLIQSNDDCAFILLCEPAMITEEFAKVAEQPENLLIGVCCAAETKTACMRLREHRLIYSVFQRFGDDGLHDVESGNFFRYAAELHAPFAAIIAEHCSEETKAAMYKAVLTARNTQQHGTIPVDLLSDSAHIQKIINQASQPGLSQ